MPSPFDLVPPHKRPWLYEAMLEHEHGADRIGASDFAPHTPPFVWVAWTTQRPPLAGVRRVLVVVTERAGATGAYTLARLRRGDGA